MEPSFEPEAMARPWRVLQYSKLAEKLKRWAAKENILPAHQPYIHDYSEMITNLGVVARQFFNAERIRKGYWFGEWQDFELLDEIGFGKSFLKFQAQLLADDFESPLREAGYTILRGKDNRCQGNHVCIWWELFNGTPCVTFGVGKGTEEPETRLEVQIQGRQYRRIMASKRINGKIARSASDKTADEDRLWKAIDDVPECDWLFGRDAFSNVEGKVIDIQNGHGKGMSLKTKMRSSLCRYQPETVHQYVNISTKRDRQEIDFTELCDWIVGDLKYAFELLSDAPEPVPTNV